MPYYTDRDSSTMRRDAERRAMQMRQRMPVGTYKRYSERAASEPAPESERVQESERPQKHEEKPKPQQKSGFPLNILGNLGNLGSFDSDTMLILAILAMLYKDGGNKKLMMALAYLLT